MIHNSTVYVLHEYGAPSHYNALIELGEQHNFNVKFRIFSPFAIAKELYHGKFKKAITSILFLLSLPLRKKSTIVIGIAPFNPLLRPLSIIIKKHEIYYHTSYTCWDRSNMAYPTTSDKLIKNWKSFVNNTVKHVFAVSNKTKTELIQNGYASQEKITVVYHSLNREIPLKKSQKSNTFIYSGRLTESKGIKELLEIFANNPEAHLTIVGRGQLEELVNEYCRKYPNISYLGFIGGLDNLIPVYQSCSFLLLNSKRTEKWEELFGIAIIEGMACGCVPITTDHSGPKEIITSGVDGFITLENSIYEQIQYALNMSDSEYQRMRNQAIKRSQSFFASSISSKWRRIND